MVQVYDRHTSEYLKEKIVECLNRYQLSLDQVYSFTTDNGANVLNATRDLLGKATADIEIDEEDTIV